MTMLAVFKSRAQTLEFISVLKASGIPAQAVNTPREAGVGCGISAKFDEGFLSRVRLCLARRPYSSYVGIMRRTGGVFTYLR